MKNLLQAIILALLCLLFISTPASAQKKEVRVIYLWGHVYDSFTRHGLPSKITLMLQDSTVVDSTKSWNDDNSSYRFIIPAKNQHYIIRAVREGYDTCYVNYYVHHIVRNDYFDAPWHYMKRSKKPTLNGENTLDEVVVRGTKIRMVQRGDTVIYDASAFNLPEGSMLDALVRQLPGAELKSNGDIYINGQKVDYLTLNGTDFFKGKNKVMLDNLPYYTVKNIKVYHKSSERSRFIGEEVEKKDYVMDVNLKREYSRGLLGNIEGGAGTKDRYLARLFSLFYGQKTRLSVYGFVNNINETRKPGGDGDWEPSNSNQGLTKTKEAGLDYSYGDSQKLEGNFSGSATWADVDGETKSHSESNVAGTNVISDNHSNTWNKSFTGSIDNRFTYKELVHHPYSIMFHTTINFSNNKNSALYEDSTMQGLPTNRSWNGSYNHGRGILFKQSVDYDKKLPWGDHLEIVASFDYNRTKPNDAFTRQYVKYLREDSDSYRNYYADTHQKSYSYMMQIHYLMNFLNGWKLSPVFSYNQQRSDIHNSNYRLDWLNDAPRSMGNDLSSQMISSWLPDMPTLLKAFDGDNSNNHSNLYRLYSYGAELTKIKTWMNGYSFLSFQLAAIHVNEKMHYTSNILDTVAHRKYFMFQPYVNYQGSSKHLDWFANYSFRTTAPDFATLMPYQDTKNSLSRSINNPNLKNGHTHETYIDLTLKDSIGNRWGMSVSGKIEDNSIGTRTIYNRLTGAYTYMQENVNGIWSESLNLRRTQYLDKAKKFTLECQVGEAYSRFVNYAIDYDDFSNSYDRTNNFILGSSIKLDYSYNKLYVRLEGQLQWRHLTSSQVNYDNIKSWDYQYGAILNYALPLGISLATDIKMYSRRGYSVSEMNTNDLVWNAMLSRSFIKGKLTAKLQAFDILHQLSSTDYAVTASGHTETWHNSIPRYLMLSLAWKFSKNPKSK